MLEDLQPAPPAVRQAVQRGLVEAGCPAEVATRLADDVTVERQDGSKLLCLHGNCVAPGQDAVELLVENVVADNAEANDRMARGEPGYTPLWPLPNRRPRRG
ncbi:MAG: hypothetical protein M3P83_08990 [Actinomycetota bacterium]|nr:hypothetical protein [Actinomycetota bacterium]